MSLSPKHIGILLFDQAELLDFAGPFEVFSSINIALKNKAGDSPHVFSIAETTDPITSANGMKVVPDYTFDDHPQIDLLILPGGNGTKEVIRDDKLMGTILNLIRDASVVLSVCTGARILAKPGFLKDKTVTTHKSASGDILALEPDCRVDLSLRFADNGKFITAGGVSAGIDASLYLCEKFWGAEVRKSVAEYIEWPD